MWTWNTTRAPSVVTTSTMSSSALTSSTGAFNQTTSSRNATTSASGVSANSQTAYTSRTISVSCQFGDNYSFTQTSQVGGTSYNISPGVGTTSSNSGATALIQGPNQLGTSFSAYSTTNSTGGSSSYVTSSLQTYSLSVNAGTVFLTQVRYGTTNAATGSTLYASTSYYTTTPYNSTTTTSTSAINGTVTTTSTRQSNFPGTSTYTTSTATTGTTTSEATTLTVTTTSSSADTFTNSTTGTLNQTVTTYGTTYGQLTAASDTIVLAATTDWLWSVTTTKTDSLGIVGASFTATTLQNPGVGGSVSVALVAFTNTTQTSEFTYTTYSYGTSSITSSYPTTSASTYTLGVMPTTTTMNSRLVTKTTTVAAASPLTSTSTATLCVDTSSATTYTYNTSTTISGDNGPTNTFAGWSTSYVTTDTITTTYTGGTSFSFNTYTLFCT